MKSGGSLRTETSHVKTVGSTTAKTQHLKAKRLGVELRKRVRQLDRTESERRLVAADGTAVSDTTKFGKQMQEGFAGERTRRQQDFDIESQRRRDETITITWTGR